MINSWEALTAILQKSHEAEPDFAELLRGLPLQSSPAVSRMMAEVIAVEARKQVVIWAALEEERAERARI